ncbi:hypothetical protein FOZ62_020716 [Perkinsus olseni]|uniref:Uncharacterized protein n=1 Tax=Perkinsus olseni TaxID=32597 RepID=A0A7J6UAN0_PEROL|nr:hypothetical protein FOZ62_020716 [Perkinsus olseni]
MPSRRFTHEEAQERVCRWCGCRGKLMHSTRVDMYYHTLAALGEDVTRDDPEYHPFNICVGCANILRRCRLTGPKDCLRDLPEQVDWGLAASTPKLAGLISSITMTIGMSHAMAQEQVCRWCGTRRRGGKGMSSVDDFEVILKKCGYNIYHDNEYYHPKKICQKCRVVLVMNIDDPEACLQNLPPMVDWGSPKDQLKDHSKCRVCLAALGRLPGVRPPDA